MYGQTTSPARILRALVDLMPEHGYTEVDVYKIPVANILRVFDACRGGCKCGDRGVPRPFMKNGVSGEGAQVTAASIQDLIYKGL